MVSMLAQLDLPFLFNRWFHLAAVIVAVGGTVFIRFIFHPAVKSSLTPEAAGPLRDVLLRRWGIVIHVCITVLILTGTYNSIVQLRRHPAVDGQVPVYHILFGVKLVLALALFFIASALTGRSKTFEALRARRPFWLGVSIALAAAIVLISNILKNLPGTL
jgi:uncharacterized membrane protein